MTEFFDAWNPNEIPESVVPCIGPHCEGCRDRGEPKCTLVYPDKNLWDHLREEEKRTPGKSALCRATDPTSFGAYRVDNTRSMSRPKWFTY